METRANVNYDSQVMSKSCRPPTIDQMMGFTVKEI